MAQSRSSEFQLGDGKISGAISAAFGVLGFCAVLCLLFPRLLTTPEMRAVYPMVWVRTLIHVALIAAFGLGLLSVILDSKRVSGYVGTALATLAMFLGGANVSVETPVRESSYIGLDWFVFNLFFLALVFIPLERLFARLPEQKIFRPGWKTDVTHFFMSHVMVQVSVMLTMVPAAIFFRWLVNTDLQVVIGEQPIWLQSIEALVLADLFAYFSHRLFHSVPWLWRFHQIHHSSESMDWLASSRLHIVDILITRAIGFVPLYILGFAPEALLPYLVFASVQAIFIHSNLRFRFGPLRYLVVTPQFHHWHHTAEAHAIDKNFAVHLPVIDFLFGTAYLPKDRWPERYGIDESAIPSNYLGHCVYPFMRQR